MKNKKPLVYLAGAIEHAPNSGKVWRQVITKYLQSELKHNVFNPCLEENHVLTPDEFQNFRKWKSSDLKRFRTVVHKIINSDLDNLINHVDYIICLWDTHALKGGGTQGELTVAFLNKIPVYMVTKMKLENISSWIIGCTSEIFQDFDHLKNFLWDYYGSDSDPD
jgi:hypothetical protein